MSNEIRNIFPELKARKPQYVLGTQNGDERTSNVTEEKIRDAIDDIEDNVAIYLEKCRWYWSDMPRLILLIISMIAVSRCVSGSTVFYSACGGLTYIPMRPLILCALSSAPHRCPT